jgi:hypothetical protein
LKDAIQIGEQPRALYDKLVVLSRKAQFAHKFQKIVLSTKETYALYDPDKANKPWRFIYFTPLKGVTEQTQIYLKDKKVHYIIVNRFEQQ